MSLTAWLVDERLCVLLQLNLVQENVKYFLELMQNQKSDFLEWTIIILIALEIILGLVELVRKH